MHLREGAAYSKPCGLKCNPTLSPLPMHRTAPCTAFVCSGTAPVVRHHMVACQLAWCCGTDVASARRRGGQPAAAAARGLCRRVHHACQFRPALSGSGFHARSWCDQQLVEQLAFPLPAPVYLSSAPPTPCRSSTGGFRGYAVGPLWELLRAFMAVDEQGASLLLLAMHLAGALLNQSVLQLLVSLAGLLHILSACCCPAWLRRALMRSSLLGRIGLLWCGPGVYGFVDKQDGRRKVMSGGVRALVGCVHAALSAWQRSTDVRCRLAAPGQDAGCVTAQGDAMHARVDIFITTSHGAALVLSICGYTWATWQFICSEGRSVSGRNTIATERLGHSWALS